MSGKKDLSVTVAGVTFKNPVIAASGTYGFGEDYAPLYPLGALGGISCKGTTIREKAGNLPPRIAETTAGMLNSVGLQNPGVDVFIRKYLPELKKSGSVIIANLAGATIDDYREAAEKLDGSDVDMIELNISCPNVKQGGATWGTTCAGAASVTKAVRAATKKPIMVKLTPNVTDITEIAKAAESEGGPYAERVRREQLSTDHAVILEWYRLRELYKFHGWDWPFPETRLEAVERWAGKCRRFGVVAREETVRRDEFDKYIDKLMKEEMK